MVHTTIWGIGNPLLKDDAAGLEIIKLLEEAQLEGFSLRSCELAPANYLATLKKEQPQRFYLIDAADMGLPAGSLRRFPLKRIADASFTSHDMPLDQILRAAAGMPQNAWVIAVQPEDTSFGVGLTPKVADAAQRAASLLAAQRAEEIQELE